MHAFLLRVSNTVGILLGGLTPIYPLLILAMGGWIQNHLGIETNLGLEHQTDYWTESLAWVTLIYLPLSLITGGAYCGYHLCLWFMGRKMTMPNNFIPLLCMPLILLGAMLSISLTWDIIANYKSGVATHSLVWIIPAALLVLSIPTQIWVTTRYFLRGSIVTLITAVLISPLVIASSGAFGIAFSPSQIPWVEVIPASITQPFIGTPSPTPHQQTTNKKKSRSSSK
jgi:hypothetical protein